MEDLIPAAWFSQGLKSGGPANGNEVTAVWFTNGAHFKGGGNLNILFTTFRQ